MTFRITGLSGQEFSNLFSCSDDELEVRGMLRCVADADFGYPDRVSMTDVPAGTELILLNYEHQPAQTPFRASGPIFVGRGEGAPVRFENEIPDCLARRPLSLRAYDTTGMMQAVLVVDGSELEAEIRTLFERQEIAYLHVPYAARGCFAARIDRA